MVLTVGSSTSSIISAVQNLQSRLINVSQFKHSMNTAGLPNAGECNHSRRSLVSDRFLFGCKRIRSSKFGIAYKHVKWTNGWALCWRVDFLLKYGQDFLNSESNSWSIAPQSKMVEGWTSVTVIPPLRPLIRAIPCLTLVTLWIENR